MWEDLFKFGEGAWESIGEGANRYMDGMIDLEISKNQEKAKDPEVLNLVEPKKATRTDGSTIVAAPVAAQQPLISGIDNTVLLVGASLLMICMVLLTRRSS